MAPDWNQQASNVEITLCNVTSINATLNQCRFNIVCQQGGPIQLGYGCMKVQNTTCSTPYRHYPHGTATIQNNINLGNGWVKNTFLTSWRLSSADACETHTQYVKKESKISTHLTGSLFQWTLAHSHKCNHWHHLYKSLHSGMGQGCIRLLRSHSCSLSTPMDRCRCNYRGWSDRGHYIGRHFGRGCWCTHQIL